MDYKLTQKARMTISGTLVFTDAQGVVVGTTEMSGTLPADDDTDTTPTEGATDGELRE